MADQWTIRYGDTPLASEEIEKLNAGLIADNLTALYVFVPPTDDLIQEVLDLKYWISARELPKPITGTLTLILKSSPPADPETQPGA
jgi:hypothetical protein